MVGRLKNFAEFHESHSLLTGVPQVYSLVTYNQFCPTFTSGQALHYVTTGNSNYITY